jgi:heptosyltransferase-3
VRVLLFRTGALGDVILLRGTIAALRAAGHEAGLLAPHGPGEALLGPGPAEVRELLSWDDPGIARWLADADATPAIASSLRSFDAALAFTRSADVVTRLRAVIPRVITADSVPRSGHAALWLADAARELGAVAVPAIPDLVPTGAERAAARPILSQLPPRFLALHPGSGSPAKNWPVERFAELARALSPSRPWLLVAGPADEAAAAALGRAPDVVLARSLPPRVLGTVLRDAGCYVGHDSGVSHLAAAFGAPVLALFGPTDPAVWAPVGRRVQVLRAPDQLMEDLSVDEVVARARTVR